MPPLHRRAAYAEANQLRPRRDDSFFFPFPSCISFIQLIRRCVSLFDIPLSLGCILPPSNLSLVFLFLPGLFIPHPLLSILFYSLIIRANARSRTFSSYFGSSNVLLSNRIMSIACGLPRYPLAAFVSLFLALGLMTPSKYFPRSNH